MAMVTTVIFGVDDVEEGDHDDDEDDVAVVVGLHSLLMECYSFPNWKFCFLI